MAKPKSVTIGFLAGVFVLLISQLACFSGGAITTPSSAVATIVALTKTPGSSLPSATIPPTITSTSTHTPQPDGPDSTPTTYIETATRPSNPQFETPLPIDANNPVNSGGLITQDNLGRLVERARLGSGRNPVIDLSGDGLLLGIFSETSIQLFDAITLSPLDQTAELISRFDLSVEGELHAVQLSDGVYLEEQSQNQLRSQLEGARDLEIEFNRDWSVAIGRLDDDVVGVWDTLSGDLVRRLDTNLAEDGALCSRLKDISISPDGAYAAAGCEEQGSAYIWRIRDGLLIHTLQADVRTLSGLTFSNQSTFMAAILPGYHIGIWRVRDGELVRVLADAHATQVMEGGEISFSRDGYYLLGAFPSGEVLAWRVSDGGLLRQVSGPGFQALLPSEGLASNLSGDILFWSDWTGLNAYNLDEGELAYRIPAPIVQEDGSESSAFPAGGPTNYLRSLAASGDGRALTAIFDRVDPKVNAFRTADGTELSDFSIPAVPLMVRQSPAGNAAAVITLSGIYLLHPTRLDPIGFLETQSGFELVESAVFSPDGKWLATGGYDTGITVWNWELKEIEVVLPGFPAKSLAFSPGGSLLAASIGNEVAIIDTTRWQKVGSIPVDGVPITFSNDGGMLVVTNQRGDILIYSMDQMKEMFRLIGHSRPIRALIFSPNGRWLASSSEDGTVRVWGLRP